jgi:hypothetical protein
MSSDTAELVDLCQWSSILFATKEAYERAQRRHIAYHRRKHLEGIVASTILRRATRLGGWSHLTEREREILTAYSRGADLW